MKSEFDYYYGAEAEQFSFLKIPKVLLEDKKHFGKLSIGAKLMYAILLDRMNLSRKNTWFDKQNRVYIVFEPFADKRQVRLFRVAVLADDFTSSFQHFF